MKLNGSGAYCCSDCTQAAIQEFRHSMGIKDGRKRPGGEFKIKFDFRTIKMYSEHKNYLYTPLHTLLRKENTEIHTTRCTLQKVGNVLIPLTAQEFRTSSSLSADVLPSCEAGLSRYSAHVTDRRRLTAVGFPSWARNMAVVVTSVQTRSGVQPASRSKGYRHFVCGRKDTGTYS